MFKKSLLALTVATATFGVNAGQIFSSASNPAVGTVAGTVNSGANKNCNDATTLTTLGLTAANITGAQSATAGGNDDTVNYDVGIYASAASIVMDTANTCVVKAKTTVSSATDKSPVEQTGSVLVDAVIVAGAGGFRQEDTITIKFTGAKIKTATIPTLTTVAKDANAKTASFDLLDITSDTVRFTVKSASGDVPGFGILNLKGADLDTTGLTSGSKVSIDYFATNTSGTKYDITDAKAIHELVPQYSAKVDRKFDGIINVSDDRKSIVADATDAKDSDSIKVTVTKDATKNEVVADSIVFDLTGNFQWLSDIADTSKDGKAVTAAEVKTYLDSKDILNKDAAGWGDFTSASLNADLTKLTLTSTAPTTAANAAGAYEIRLVVPGKSDTNPVLQTQTFTVSTTVKDATAAPKTISMKANEGAAAGEWKLNGSVVAIPYMPFDDNTAVILRHTNTGVQTGDVSVRYMLEGVDTNWVDAGVVGSSSRGVKDIRDAVINAIKTKSGKTSGKAAIEITTNVPAADVTVFAGFKVKDESDRGIVGTFGHLGSAQNKSNVNP